MFLITTADQRFWKTDEKILFLGEWCRRHDQRHIWADLDCEVLPYHWDDREKLYRDYLYVHSLYERYLSCLAEQLNQYHGLKHSVRYWRIVVGFWLSWFIESLYDRYLSIHDAAHARSVSSTWINNTPPCIWAANDFSCFVKRLISDEYNHFLYSQIIKRVGGIPFVEKTIPPTPTSTCAHAFAPRRLARRVILKLLEAYTRAVPDHRNRIALIRSDLPRWDLMRLQISLGQWPTFDLPMITPAQAAPDDSRRRSMEITGLNEFESLLGELTPTQIPTAYLEAYSDLRQRAMASFPAKPDSIFTAIAYAFDDAFKIWAAEKVECGATLAVGQHGGHYGTGRWSSTEEHQIAISDRYYSWGWQLEAANKVVPLPAGRLAFVQRTAKYNSKGYILWVAMSMPRYSYWMYSIPVGPQMLAYLDEQYRFARSVSPAVHALLMLRLYPEEYGWCESSHWGDVDPTLQIYRGSKSFAAQLSDSRLLVATYNATTILEAFAADFPTIMFWNPHHWELRPDAQPYFDELRRTGILHDTPESAATAANNVYRDPLCWWRSPEIQQAKDTFCQRFAFTRSNWLEEWKNELKRLSAASLSES